jgi:hypothetical protein
LPALCLWVLGSSKLKECNQLAEVLRKIHVSSTKVLPKSNFPKLQNTGLYV